ncbi:MAG TPA: GNAT family N-acetyltransferase [Gaiellales bacterium]|jgi:GNAT superfamily N-acetyltransferase
MPASARDRTAHVRIRAAAAGEGERLREITTAAKGFWDYDPARVREWGAALDLSPGRLATAYAYVAELDGRAVAWAEILPPAGGVCVLEHLWVDPALIRRGLGSRLFEFAAERARELGATALEWEAERNALGFYRMMGGRHLRTEITEWGREGSVMGIDLR